MDKIKIDLKHFKFQNRALTDVVDHMHTEMEDLKGRIENLELNSMKNAVSISGLTISENKWDGIHEIEQFLYDQLECEVNVDDFFQSGNF